MQEHEQNETEEPEDLEPSEADEDQVVGGATSEFVIVKVVDKPSPGPLR